MKPLPQLTPDCLIRFIYSGEFDYATLHEDQSYTVHCRQQDLDRWKAGSPIKPLIYCDNQKLQTSVRLLKERLRAGTPVIQGVWRKGRFEPRKLVTS